MALVLGIDEAGRGPVIGPLVLCGVMIDESKKERLKEMGVKDSKLLTHPQRLKLSSKIKDLADEFKLIIVEPKEIDEAVTTPGMNLNWLEAHKSAQIINELDPDKVILDCPSPNIKRYTSYLKELLDDDSIEIDARHKADRDFVVVGAASILAKCEREDQVLKIEKMVGQSIGSGYPSNPVCQKFLKENGEKYPEIFRKSWMTWKGQEQAKKQKTLSEF